jgi:tetratricopeptide (TPR) repeat protein
VQRAALAVAVSVGNLILLIAAEAANGPGAEILTKENVVDVKAQKAAWIPATVGQMLAVHDGIRTGEDSRATVRLSDLSVLRINELTETEILPPQETNATPTLNLKQGSTYFFSREKSRELQIKTPAANGAIRGTEFVATVASNGNTTVTMLDGELELSNAHGSVLVRSGEQANAEPGRKPTKTAVIEAINSVQWCLYYPGVLDLNELAFSAAEKRGLEQSLSAYRAGDLLAALKAYPRFGISGSNADKIYHAGLFLVVGQVAKAEHLLREVKQESPGRDALATLIAAVTLKTHESRPESRTTSGWIAESYYRQSKADLAGALDAAQKAIQTDPSFGFAWTRLAELQFSFGRVPQSIQALEKGLTLSPRNPAAYALRGFLSSAENKINEAKEAFEKAMEIDGALGNAWLGRGLCFIRQGKPELGRLDLQTAAALEPNRSMFHSYLGKAFSNVDNEPKARLELNRAKELDPGDPTPWIYSALENKQDNRINEAVRDLEKSLELNDNRRVYRSQFLLDQDRAVRSANLAAIYQDDGMDEVSVREASRGVDYDYTSASSHLFLANSYNALRDPNRINLRYETPWFNELLLANLLSPVGGGPLSQYVSEQEYSKLFEANRFGISSTSNYFTTGEIRETASQYGIFGNISYSLDTEFQYNNGLRPNNEITRSESYGQAKVQLSLQDTVFVQTKYQDTREGDLLQYYDQSSAAPGVHFRELQQPAIILAGYHHEWAPGVDTLLLVGRLADDVSYSNLNRTADVNAFAQSGLLPNINRSLVFVRDPNGEVVEIFPLPVDLQYHNTFTTYTGELNQIFETDSNRLIFGARFQSGEFHTSDFFNRVQPLVAPLFMNPAAAQDFETSLERESFYAYDTWRPFRTLSITAAVSYDRLSYPTNHRNPPIVDSESSRARVSPKAGLIWNPTGNLVLRAAYARSLGGVSFDESVQLEPTEVAGFNQVFRTIISESLIGSVAAPTYESGGLLIENKFSSGTYAGVQATIVRSDVNRRAGIFEGSADSFGNINAPIVASSTPQTFRYEEDNLLLTLNQLVGSEWSFGARYQVTFSDLQTIFSGLPKSVLVASLPPGPTQEFFPSPSFADSRQKATLHQAQIFALYNHPSGFFGRVEEYWAQQSNVGYGPDIPGDEILQLNVYAGYRFRRNYGDITLGFLNLTDQNYKLNPLNYYSELPRDRTLQVRVRLNF